MSKQDKYLGIDTSSNCNSNKNLASLNERISLAVQSWKGKLLNQEGSAILIKSVQWSISTHHMSCFKLPKQVLEDMNRSASNFWWGQNNGKNKSH